MGNKLLHPNDLRALNYTHLKEAVGDYGEREIARLIDGCIRSPKNKRYLLPPKKAGGEKGADLTILNKDIDCEVKMREGSQALYVGRRQLHEMQDREKYENIDQYYAFCFYNTISGKRMGELSPIGQEMTEYGIRLQQLRYVNMIQVQTIFFFPLPVVFEYFQNRDAEFTRKFGGSVWSSNKGPIKSHFEDLKRSDTLTLSAQGFTKSKPNMKIHIVGEEMIDHLQSVQRNTGLILQQQI